MITSAEPTTPYNVAKPLPVQVILESLEYDLTSPSGLRWKTRPRSHFVQDWSQKVWNKNYAGKPAGATSQGKYWQVMLNGVNYLGHRLVWCVFYGSDLGKSLIDHISGDGFDNRIENLRLATSSQNLSNKRKTDKNTSGVVGVTWDKANNKWMAQICVNRKNIKLGRFESKDDAALARKAAEIRYRGEFSYGESQRIAALMPQLAH